MKVAILLAASAVCSNAFTVPPVARVSSPSSTVMRLGGYSKGANFSRGSKFSLSNFFRAVNKRVGGNGGGGMIGGNGNNGGMSSKGMGSFEDDENNNAMPVALMGGVLGQLWADYNDVLTEKPVLTKACTSLVGFSVGDTLAQKFVSKEDKFDYKRLARMAAFGFVFHGTISHFFYQKLDTVIPGKDPVSVAKKVFTDQVLWAPIFTFIYLTYMGLTTGLSPSGIYDKIKNDLIKGVVGSWSVWPIVHAIGFTFVPPEQRLLYINCIQIGYNIFLSVLGSNKVPAKPAVVVKGKASAKPASAKK